jgi:ABC-2 type transport system ATP-binding protein
MTAVTVSDLRKEFRRRDGDRLRRRTRRVPALADVSFTIQRGECVAVLGQNGSGKSTLVRLLSTLLLNDGGSAAVFGHDVFAEPRAVRRLVNRVSVEASFFKRLSSAENLAYAARFYGMGPRETGARIPEILTRVGFPAERRSEPMENLSRGMQQKVALARALLTSPVLLLLDEPTTGLDLGHQIRALELVDGLRRTHGLTVLSTMHDLTLAGRFADRFALLSQGRLVSTGTRTDVLNEAVIAEHFGASVRVIGDAEIGWAVVPISEKGEA